MEKKFSSIEELIHFIQNSEIEVVTEFLEHYGIEFEENQTTKN